ncbi:hypothetical protein BDA99DRAFT_541091 [Phascolomyces articulosus]|uniref:Uncharacterized protein n=1 Tax=Phascolomyces articulosus TaxID=60185 RepID=A0AAD5JSJ6_9FUNG|nr:hypothetical protein BDA99DRAFT_541091 [Phascolomyces articulosus]
MPPIFGLCAFECKLSRHCLLRASLSGVVYMGPSIAGVLMHNGRFVGHLKKSVDYVGSRSIGAHTQPQDSSGTQRTHLYRGWCLINPVESFFPIGLRMERFPCGRIAWTLIKENSCPPKEMFSTDEGYNNDGSLEEWMEKNDMSKVINNPRHLPKWSTPGEFMQSTCRSAQYFQPKATQDCMIEEYDDWIE